MIKEGRALDPFLSLHDLVNELEAAGQLTAVSPENRKRLGELIQKCADAEANYSAGIVEDTRLHEMLKLCVAAKQLSELGANLIGLCWNALSVDQRKQAFTDPAMLKLEAAAKVANGELPGT